MSQSIWSSQDTLPRYRGEAGVLATKYLQQDTWPSDEAEATGRVRHVAAGCEVYSEGDWATSFYKVTSGAVRTCRFLSDGRRQVDAFHMVGDVFGLEAGDRHRLTAEAINECTVIGYRRNRTPSAVDDGIRFARQFFDYAMQQAERAQEHSLLLGRRNAVEKLAAFLLEIAERQGSDDEVDLVMSRQDIADYLGLAIETVSRTMSQLEREAAIGMPNARHIVLRNTTLLRRLKA